MNLTRVYNYNFFFHIYIKIYIKALKYRVENISDSRRVSNRYQSMKDCSVDKMSVRAKIFRLVSCINAKSLALPGIRDKNCALSFIKSKTIRARDGIIAKSLEPV